MEGLGRPVSGERSSHDDNESVGSVRPGSAASSNITGILKNNRTHSVENGRDGKEGGTSLKCLWGGRGGTFTHAPIGTDMQTVQRALQFLN